MAGTGQEGQFSSALSTLESLTLDHVPVLIWVSGPDGGCTWFNRCWLDFTGRPLEAQLGRGWIDAVHPDDAASVLGILRGKSDARAPFEIQYRLRRRDGAFRWISSRGEPRSDAAGEFLGYVGACTDIHEATELRQRLWSSQRRLRLAQGAAGLAIWEWDLATNEVVWSPELAALHGLPPEDYDKSLDRYMSTVHPDDRARIRDATAYLEHGDNIQLDYRIQLPGQEERWLASWATVSRGEDGKPTNIVGMAMEITERKKAEQRLANSAANLQLMASVGGLLQGYHDTKELMQAAARYTVEAFADLCIVDIRRGNAINREFVLHRDTALDVGAVAHVVPQLSPDDPIGHVVLSGEPLLRSQKVGTDWWPDGIAGPAIEEVLPELRPLSAISAPIRWRDETFGAITLLRTGNSSPFDTPELGLGIELAQRIGAWMARARLIEELEEANAAKDEFLGLVSHELKNPLTTILGISSLLADRSDRLSPPAMQDAFEALRKDSSRLAEIIENMLTLARLGVTGDFEPLLLQRVLPAVVERWRKRQPGRSISLSCPDDLPPVDALPTWIEQVLDNLIGNAIKYSPAGSPIDVVVMQTAANPSPEDLARGIRPSALQVAVVDHGPGIDPAMAERFFEPFYRGGSHLPSVPGLGLGLTVCKRIIERLDGQIWIDPPDGTGTSVRFCLPALPESEAPLDRSPDADTRVGAMVGEGEGAG